MSFAINRNLTIFPEVLLGPVRMAALDLLRDVKTLCLQTQEPGGCLVLQIDPELPAEQFRLSLADGSAAVGGPDQAARKLLLEAGDEMGLVYGIYEISRRFLGVKDFWFWNDQVFCPQDSFPVPDGFCYESKPFAVRFRGWFINDEVLLYKWHIGHDPEKPWEMALETLLRLGGNLVIAGTGLNAERYRPLAVRRGLYITHHHAEPLGAQMFADKYPDLPASYLQYPELFQGLWRDALEAQAGQKTIWTLGFRGQGDHPFWDDDPYYDTDEKRGKLLSDLIRLQYDMVREQNSAAVMCTNLYGEAMELYQAGCLEIPDDVIRIWADNGYGKMVTRRQGNHNPRVPALPEPGEGGKHGIYYHVSFYDLQAANHMTMLQNPPDFVRRELREVLRRGCSDFWIINSSNVKPHVYYLDYLSKIWRDGDADPAEHRREYLETYYPCDRISELEAALEGYHKAAVFYGKEEDERAGEQYTNYVPRVLATQLICGRSDAAQAALWAFPGAKTLQEQVQALQEICVQGEKNYSAYLLQCEQTAVLLPEPVRCLFEDSFLLQAQMHAHCWAGAARFCTSLMLHWAGEAKKAFYYAGLARREYLKADAAMRAREHGKWHDFYANECLTDIKHSADVMEKLMGTLRALGDGPYYYFWQRDFFYSEQQRRITLISHLDNHLTDQQLFEQMDRVWGDEDK